MNAIIKTIKNILNQNTSQIDRITFATRKMENKIAWALFNLECKKADELYSLSEELGLPISNLMIENVRQTYEAIYS